MTRKRTLFIVYMTPKRIKEPKFHSHGNPNNIIDGKERIIDSKDSILIDALVQELYNLLGQQRKP
jgi:hypothetical protein